MSRLFDDVSQHIMRYKIDDLMNFIIEKKTTESILLEQFNDKIHHYHSKEFYSINDEQYKYLANQLLFAFFYNSSWEDESKEYREVYNCLLNKKAIPEKYFDFLIQEKIRVKKSIR
ncbi:hypothetical protein [Serratia nevei]|uniref:hypothetical protein n=1 Tax=Serratia nevei TaxID=2703794 RepID=UPI003F821AFF